MTSRGTVVIGIDADICHVHPGQHGGLGKLQPLILTLLSFLDSIPHVKQQLVLCVPSMPHGCDAGIGLGQLGIPGSQRIPGACQLLLQLIALQQQASCTQQSVSSEELHLVFAGSCDQ